MNGMILFLELLGTVAFSISGAIEAMKKGMDMLGVLVLGLVTAVGGGVIRDIIIGKLPPAVFQNPRNALLALGTALISFLIGMIVSRHKHKEHHAVWNQVMLVSDAVGLGAFTILGIRGVQEQAGFENTALLLFVGVITGVGGGLLRDIFAGNVPYIFRKHVYATASIAGATTYLCLERSGHLDFAAIATLLLVLLLRLLAARFQWNLPRVHLDDE